MTIGRVQAYDGGALPWARVASPPLGVAAACALVGGAACGEDGDVAAVVALGGRDEADAAVAVLVMRCDA
jgi:hypothetical protein